MTPRGERLTQSLASELAEGPGVMVLAGRFEGIDERVIQAATCARSRSATMCFREESLPPGADRRLRAPAARRDRSR